MRFLEVREDCHALTDYVVFPAAETQEGDGSGVRLAGVFCHFAFGGEGDGDEGGGDV